jgi:molecular chaperone DnaK (HSP70)
MRQEAEQHAEEDKQHKALVEARNNADNAVYGAEKAMRDLGDKVPDDVKNRVNDAIEKVRGTLESEDATAIKEATDNLMQEVQQIGAAAYQQAGPEMGGSPPPGDSGEADDSGPDDEDVVDGEFKDAE